MGLPVAIGSSLGGAAGSAGTPVAGFEASGYVRLDGHIVFAGRAGDGRAGHEHPRNLLRPWRPSRPKRFDAAALERGAALALDVLKRDADRWGAQPGLLPWLIGRPLAFPLQSAVPRLEALRTALRGDDLGALEHAALRLLGLGPGLTPSGDDLLGGLFFALAYAPRPAWRAPWPALRSRLLAASEHATHAISAALLADLMHGVGYRALHEMLAALQARRADRIETAIAQLAAVGASSGTDLLAGVLLAFNTAVPTS